ncbi:hypothetical protein CDAR_511601 [Caerostris darwini]|uniref:Uncharacterized protein n=1 Tax=Caerostris darwini TaxID=1538125 RepID=A0AAV4WVC6_9ARAC|nr:hypothetical protein CDAR_511601 [Caerostris darwini]
MLLSFCLDEWKWGTEPNPLLQMSSLIFDYTAACALDFRNKALTFSPSLANLQYRRGTPVNHRGGGGIRNVPSALMILRSSGDHF